MWELAHVIMETEESHNMPSASRRIRKSGIVIQFILKAWEPGGCWCKFKVGRPKNLRFLRTKIDAPAKEERENLHFLHLFLLFRLPTNWLMTTHIGEGKFIYNQLTIKCWFLLETPSQTCQK